MNTKFLTLVGLITLYLTSCNSDDSNSSTTTTDESDTSTTILPEAYSEFSDNVTVTLSGSTVTIETNGLPDHESPYWSNTTQRAIHGITTPGSATNHSLFIEPTATSYTTMSPGNIDDFNGSHSLSVSVNPTQANSSTSTGLGAIGIAVSGAVIYNDEEGPNVPLDNAVSSLDYTGAHTGPQSYHYHLETKAWSNDDHNLIGVMADGFFLYGRRNSENGEYPTDLDASGGHFGPTVHNSDGEYHYHIQNDLYLNQYYILFPGDYQGTPSSIQ